MRLTALPIALLVATAASAQDEQLDALHATLASVHSLSPEVNYETLGATAELTVAKHQLRDWIEQRLSSLKDFEQVEAASAQINSALRSVSVTDSENEQNLLGSLGEVRFSNEGGLLLVTTAVGILCQYDVSAYAYQDVDGRWQRVWESEQTDYSPKKYAPQHIVAVHAWQAWKDGRKNGPPFVMTLGNSWGCGSTWHSVIYRVWRIDPSGTRLLIDESEGAWLRTYSYIVGSIGRDWGDESPLDVLIEFTERSIDGGVHNRQAVRHFLIQGDRVRRVDPVALNPRDFVDEWLTRTWDESSAWSASTSLQQWHRRFHADFVSGDFHYPTTHCQTPDLWQVAVTLANPQKSFEPEADLYFLLRWSPPYHFTMLEISDRAGWPRCTQKDPEADQWRTLFNTQEWRW